MPIKPWALKRQSLGVFEGLGDVLDARAGREAEKVKQQQTLEDRLAQQQQREAAGKSRTLEDALRQAQLDALKAPKVPKIIGQKQDEVTGEVFNLKDDGTAEPVRVSRPFEGHENDDATHGQPQQAPPQTTLRLGKKPEAPKARRTQLVKDHRGMEVIVDLDTGLGQDGKPVRAWQEPEKPVKTGVDALPPAQQNEVKMQQSSLLNLSKAIRNVDKAVQANGLAFVGNERAAMDAVLKEAQIQYKEAARLGVLNGPDLTLIEQAMGNATNPTQILRGGAKGVRTALKAAIEALRSRARTMEQVYGATMPGDFYSDDETPAAPVAPAAGKSGGPMPTLDPRTFKIGRGG